MIWEGIYLVIVSCIVVIILTRVGISLGNPVKDIFIQDKNLAAGHSYAAHILDDFKGTIDHFP